jgi:GTP-binding protein Era
MLITDQHPLNKSIVVGVIGRPNAGKSTLINNFLGQELSIVSPLPQTTRNHFHCAMTVDHTEIIFVDTPGVHSSAKELNLRMNQEAEFASEGADFIMLLIDPTYRSEELVDKTMIDLVNLNGKPVMLIFTKKDKAPTSLTQEDVKAMYLSVAAQLQNCVKQWFWISAKTEENVHKVLSLVLDAAPSSPHLYPQGDLSNKNMRFFVSEYIREQVFYLLKNELPYEIAVTIDEYMELDGPTKTGKDIKAKISATILVNRASQRAIVVGTGGAMIKEIGLRARQRIESLLGGQIFLNLHVKVSPLWFKNNLVLEQLGLPRSKSSSRVWREK